MNQNPTYAAHVTLADIEDEADALAIMAAYEYQRIQEEEAESSFRLTRNPIHREREVAEERLKADYFNVHCKYPDRDFRHRFRMSRKLFLEIVSGIESYTADPLPAHFAYFSQEPDCTGRMGISVLMKCTMAIRQLAYGNTPDAFDEYLQMSARTGRECLDNFNMCVIDLFKPEFLRKPTLHDIENLYAKHEKEHGFPGMLGSIDCMHWQWKNCPVSWQGQYVSGHKKYPTILLEAVASHDLWIWHAFFGIAGANNDINVLDNSPLFDDLLNDEAPVAPFAVNGVVFDKGYYLADGIYPQWATFVKSFTTASDEKHSFFKKRQESARKDVERAFGVLQGRWGIIQQPARAYEVSKIRRIMYSCIILHNMILKDQKYALSEYRALFRNPARNMQDRWIDRCDVRRRRNKELRDKDVHLNLQQQLMEHIWREREEFMEVDDD